MTEDWLDRAIFLIAGTTDIKVAAARMAARELKGLSPQSSILEIAAKHGALPLIRELAHGPAASVSRLGDSYLISLNSNDNEARRRFSLAHEIGHIILAEASGRQVHETSDPRSERLLDEFASRLLLPDELLAAWLAALKSIFSIKDLEHATKELQVSMSVLVKRIGQTQLLDRISRGVIVGAVSKSRKGRKTPALRVHQVASPSWGFIPLNRRLASIGLVETVGLFEKAKREQKSTGLVQGTASLLVKSPPSYKWATLSTTVEQKVYRVRATGEQFVLLVFDWPCSQF